MSDLLLQLPFAETGPVTESANPVTPSRPLRVKNGAIAGDTPGRALTLQADGYAEMPGLPPFSLSASFTFTGWVKAFVGATNTYLLFKFAGTDRYVRVVLGTSLSSWTLLTIQQVVSGTVGTLTVKLGGQQVESGTYPDGWGMPTGFCLYNDDSTAASGRVSWAGVNVYTGEAVPILIGEVTYDPVETARPILIGEVTYDLVTTQPPVTTPPVTGVNVGTVAYYLNGWNLTGFGIRVKGSEGITGGLKRKEPTRYDWADAHGEVVDLAQPRFEARTITLTCWLKASTSTQFLERWLAFQAELTKAGTQRLQINVYQNKPLVYEVYCIDTPEITKKWRPDTMYAQFTLTLREPSPIKRVLSFTGPGTVTMNVSTSSLIDIHWGDGLHSYDVYGTNQAVSHTYTVAGTYYIIIAGVLSDITTLTHNATVTWANLM